MSFVETGDGLTPYATGDWPYATGNRSPYPAAGCPYGYGVGVVAPTYAYLSLPLRLWL